MRFVDLKGKKFGKLTVIELESRTPIRWKCLCDCGNYHSVLSSNLTSGNVKSCGCVHKIGNPVHGKCYTRVYRIYAKIKRRCLVADDIAYPNYGGRGITICDKWKNDFLSFYEWAMTNGYSDELTIDRIDNNKGYCPENCRWTDYKNQNNNTRRNRYITYKGEIKTLKQWCEEFQISYKRTHWRLQHGWSFEEAITINKYSTRKEKSNERTSRTKGLVE